MKRRDFFTAASSMMLPVMVDGFGVKTMAKNSALVQSLMNSTALNDDRVLVIIYLGGGNDGLNTVIPIEFYSEYYNLRSNIAIPEAKVLKLSGNSKTGLHPSMTGLQKMYNEGNLSIVHSVSYPNASQSHVRSTDIFMTAVDYDKTSTSGWAGRFLANTYPGYPTNYPNASMEDPLAVQIGYIGATALSGPQPMGITLKDPSSFYELIGAQTSSWTDLPAGDAGAMISYIRKQQTVAVGYAAEIKLAADKGKNLATYPASTNDLSESLKIVARMIHGGLKSKVYYVEMPGFDTHAAQVDASTTEGVHANLLKKLSDAIAAFHADLKLQGTADRVVGMTFSDFGRRATSNASKGTDHGVASPMFVFGNGVKRSEIGTNPDLVADLLPVNPSASVTTRDIKMQIDFRRVYNDILNGWFGATQSTTNTIMLKSFSTTSLFSDTVISLGSGAWVNRDTWSNGRVPATTETIVIKAGHVITVGQNITVKKITVEAGGELKFLGNYKVTVTG